MPNTSCGQIRRRKYLVDSASMIADSDEIRKVGPGRPRLTAARISTYCQTGPEPAARTVKPSMFMF
jgi:hypothetical protein